MEKSDDVFAKHENEIDKPLPTLIKRFEQTKQIYLNIYKGTRFLFHLSKPKSSIFSISFDDRYYNETRVEWLKKLSVDISDEFTDYMGVSFNLLKKYYQAEIENRKIIENSLCGNILPKINEMSTPEYQEIVEYLKKLKKNKGSVNKNQQSPIPEKNILKTNLEYKNAKIDAYNCCIKFLDHQQEYQHSVLMEYVMSIRDYHKNLYEVLENCCKNMSENDIKIKERNLLKLKNKSLIIPDNAKLSHYNKSKSQIPEREIYVEKMEEKNRSKSESYLENNLYIDLLPGTRVIAKFEMKCEREEDLEFKKGDIINVIENIDDNWACGYIDGKKFGIFPKSYVKIYIS